MRIAHIIMTHKNPDQLLRLIKRLTHPEFDIYVHIDAKTQIKDYSSILSIDRVNFIKNRVKCNWGGNSLLQGIISSMNEVLLLKKGYDFINLLSAQDYPVIPVQEIYNYFSQKKGLNFISYETSKESEWLEEATSRYEKYHLTDFNFRSKYFIQKILNTFLPKRKFPIPWELYGGSKSTWWTISEPCAAHVSSELSSNKKLARFLKYTWGSDEFVLTTLIMNSKFKEVTINNNLRYIDWSEGNARPKLLNIDDYEKIRQSGMIFARKFDTDVDELILNEIDKNLLRL